MAIEVGKPYLSNGRSVRILCVDADSSRPVIGLVSTEDGEAIMAWYKDGTYYKENPSCVDLVEVPTEKLIMYLPYFDKTFGKLYHASELGQKHPDRAGLVRLVMMSDGTVKAEVKPSRPAH